MSRLKKVLAPFSVLGLFVLMSPVPAAADSINDSGIFNVTLAPFNMVVTVAARTCLPGARATVQITPVGSLETMDITVTGLPPNQGFALFVIQVPEAPFGLSWYQGNVQTDKSGMGHEHFVGRFSIQTFVVAPGGAPAPIVFRGAFPDASLNPPFNPVHLYHLGLWFDSPQAAQAAGCPAAVTPFNGEHNAGIQVLNTGNFPESQGPLRK
jgi:hypothetical protein